MPLVKSQAGSETVSLLLKPIDEEHPEGQFSEDDDLYLAIEDEMIKLGGLQSATIHWDQVEKNAKTYLAERCKHLRVVGHIAHCWLQLKRWGAWTDACALLGGFCDQYLVVSYPKPGPKGLGAKHKLVVMQLNRLKNALEELPVGAQFKSEIEQAEVAAKFLQVALEKNEFPPLVLETVEGVQKKLQQLAATPQPPASRPEVSPNQHGGQAIDREFFAPVQSASTLPISNERDLRRTLLAISEAINQHDAYDPVGYMLRRYALWSSIKSSPIVVKDNRTELMPVAAESIQAYHEALESNKITPALLQRVEKSVSSSVYWFNGSYLAFQIARSLSMDEVADAILNSTVRFVRRVPVLLNLQFSNGQPFADEHTRAWISSAGSNQTAQGGAVDHDYSELQNQLTQLMADEGIEAVLLEMQKLQDNGQSPRQQCRLMKIAADLFAERRLTWLSDDLYSRIERRMAITMAAQWEPDLYEHVAFKTGEAISENTEQGADQT